MTEPKYRDWSNYSPGALGLVRFRTLILIIRSANHIVKPLAFLRFSYSFSASSTPPFRVGVFSFFLNSPPPLNSVNRFSIRLPPRISGTLENSHRFQL